jgi:hypothetical protein
MSQDVPMTTTPAAEPVKRIVDRQHLFDVAWRGRPCLIERDLRDSAAALLAASRSVVVN